MNKNDLIDALTPRLGDRATAALAVEAVVDVVLREVAAGGSVGITGFGTFEQVERAARTGRNPHTGEAVPIAQTRSPRFRPGSYFRDVVTDPGLLPPSGLAGARVGTGEADAGRRAPVRPVRGGAPASVRRSAASTRRARPPARVRPIDPVPEDELRDELPVRRSRIGGAPATVRAEKAPGGSGAAAPLTPAAAPSARAARPGADITWEMITAKKAQRARAQDDQAHAERSQAAKDSAGKKKADKKAGTKKAQKKKAGKKSAKKKGAKAKG